MNPVLRRLSLWMLAGGIAGAMVLAGLYLARRPLIRVAVTSMLEKAGAAEVKVGVAEASPRLIVFSDLGFRYQSVPFSAGPVTVRRARWWTPTLGAVRVENARLELDPAAVSYLLASTDAGPGRLPWEEFSIDGQVVVRTDAVPGAQVLVTFDARANNAGDWEGNVMAATDGLNLAAEGTYRRKEADVVFRVPQGQIDLQVWQGQLQEIFPLPGGRAELAGVLTVAVEGTVADGLVQASGTVSVRDGALTLPGGKFAAVGISYDAEFTDLVRLVSKPGTVRVNEVTAGGFQVRNLDAVVTFEDSNRMAVARAAFEALGGGVSAEPFVYQFDRAELAAVVVASRLDVAEIVALAKDLPARATGRVDGRVPLRIDATGVKFGTGWLALTPGVPAELQLNAKGLLTRGNNPKSPAYAVLEKVETGLLRLKLGEMRLDIYPPNQPPGRSARLRLAGEPADPTVKAPVTLDLNVNGPLEQLINLGLDPRVGTGSGK